MVKPTIDFIAFPKIARLSREIIITEKIDGTNAGIYIPNDMSSIHAASRTKWITPEDDNHGFAKWVESNKEELMKLGPGLHHGEWWGAGVNKRYPGFAKTFSLFNTSIWTPENKPTCCSIVPVLYRGVFDGEAIIAAVDRLAKDGSIAAPGIMKPEGIVIYHVASNQLYKKTLEKDESPKGLGN